MTRIMNLVALLCLCAIGASAGRLKRAEINGSFKLAFTCDLSCTGTGSTKPGPTSESTELTPTGPSGSSEPNPTSGSTDTNPTSGSTETSPTSGSTETSPTSGSTDTNPTSGSTDTNPTSGSTDTNPTSGSTETNPTSGSTETSPTSGSTETSPTGSSEPDPTGSGGSTASETSETSPTVSTDPTPETSESTIVSPGPPNGCTAVKVRLVMIYWLAIVQQVDCSVTEELSLYIIDIFNAKRGEALYQVQLLLVFGFSVQNGGVQAFALFFERITVILSRVRSLGVSSSLVSLLSGKVSISVGISAMLTTSVQDRTQIITIATLRSLFTNAVSPKNPQCGCNLGGSAPANRHGGPHNKKHALLQHLARHGKHHKHAEEKKAHHDLKHKKHHGEAHHNKRHASHHKDEKRASHHKDEKHANHQ